MSELGKGSGSKKSGDVQQGYGMLALIVVILWFSWGGQQSKDLEREIGALRGDVRVLEAVVQDLADEARAARLAESGVQTPLGKWRALDEGSAIEFREDGTFTLDDPGGAANGHYTRSWQGRFQLDLSRGSAAAEKLIGQLYTSGNELEITGPPARGRSVSRYLREE